MQADISILGAGAFGTALGVTLARAGRRVALWARDPGHVAEMQRERMNTARLPGVPFAPGLEAVAEPAPAPITLIATPTQAMRAVLSALPAQSGTLVACCKGIERATGLLPARVIADLHPSARVAVLTGPSFATDIAQGKPTALTLAATGDGAEALQVALAAPALRPYLTDDLIGAQLGGALKNVVAIAAGVVTGMDLGESARASVITRGFAEMARLATMQGARIDTLTGLSGFGDLVLTCTSDKSRNYRFGIALGGGTPPASETVEGLATAHALAEGPQAADMPIATMVSALAQGRVTPHEAQDRLLNRPLRRET